MKTKAAEEKAKDRARLRADGFVIKQIAAKPKYWDRHFKEIKRLCGHKGE